MHYCDYCGDEIVFRYVEGRRVPIHQNYSGCSEGGDFLAKPKKILVKSFSEFCAPSHCPRCKGSVYFIRHNGGSVWVDELGWPWPRHGCMSDEPGWYVYLRSSSKFERAVSRGAPVVGDRVSVSDEIIGVVVAARRLSCDDGVAYVGLAIDAGSDKRLCIAIDADNTTSYHLGTIVLVQQDRELIYSSNCKQHRILNVVVVPKDLGFAENQID